MSEYVNYAMNVSEIKPMSKYILLILANICDENGFCKISYQDLSEYALLDPTSVPKPIRELLLRGMITKTDGSGRNANGYQIMLGAW